MVGGNHEGNKMPKTTKLDFSVNSKIANARLKRITANKFRRAIDISLSRIVALPKYRASSLLKRRFEADELIDVNVNYSSDRRGSRAEVGADGNVVFPHATSSLLRGRDIPVEVGFYSTPDTHPEPRPAAFDATVTLPLAFVNPRSGHRAATSGIETGDFASVAARIAIANNKVYGEPVDPEELERLTSVARGRLETIATTSERFFPKLSDVGRLSKLLNISKKELTEVTRQKELSVLVGSDQESLIKLQGQIEIIKAEIDSLTARIEASQEGTQEGTQEGAAEGES